MDLNKEILKKNSRKYNFLFDTSSIIYLEALWKRSGASIFKALGELPDVNFFVVNDVVSELISGKNASPVDGVLNTFFNHILNSESSMAPNYKENKFLIEQGGEVKYIILNKISATDYAQILLCQNHLELTLVTNDRKMLKSGARVILGRRILGIPAFLNKLVELHPDNKRLASIKATAELMFIKKRP